VPEHATEAKLREMFDPRSEAEKRERVLEMMAAGIRDREALIALVRWLGESGDILLPGHLHDQIRRALGDDFYREVAAE
jgi:hypothetical protein